MMQLYKHYGSPKDRITALSDINICIEEGEIFGFIGKSGAGKSTLLHCINLLEKPSSGQVFIDNQNLLALNKTALRDQRRHIGMIFQHFNLLESRTVYENIALPLRFMGLSQQTIDQRILPLLDLVELPDQKNQYPAQLSGGQKQRVAIARALAAEPKVLLCDEATSALDPQTTTAILNLLRDINRRFKLTIVLITHETHVIKTICDRVGILENGRIVEYGDTLQIFTQPQTATAKAFANRVLQQELPTSLPLTLHPTPQPDSNPLLRLSFFGTTITQPILTTTIKQYDLSLNIIQGSIEPMGHDMMGVMIVELLNQHNRLPEITASLAEHGLRLEIIAYVSHLTD